MSYSPEDVFMMEGVQAASQNVYSCVENKYWLHASVNYTETCNDNETINKTEVPLTIVPLVNPMCFGFKPPGGWAPIDYGTFEIKVSQRYDGKKEESFEEVVKTRIRQGGEE